MDEIVREYEFGWNRCLFAFLIIDSHLTIDWCSLTMITKSLTHEYSPVLAKINKLFLVLQYYFKTRIWLWKIYEKLISSSQKAQKQAQRTATAWMTYFCASWQVGFDPVTALAASANWDDEFAIRQDTNPIIFWHEHLYVRFVPCSRIWVCPSRKHFIHVIFKVTM